MPVTPACTITANNYLALATVFAESFTHHHPGAPIFACIADLPDPRVDYEALPFKVVFAHQLGIPQFRNMAFRYNLLELNTAVKPFFLQHLRDVEKLDRVLYFDPDILVLDRLTGIEQALSTHQVVLTPHITEPLDNAHRPSEIIIRACGVYNLGFVGLALDEATAPFLDWWADRVHEYCYSDVPAGLFVDQSWMEYAPAFLERAAIMRDPAYNVAYWNLPHRNVRRDAGRWCIGETPVGFFHFSGVSFDDLEIVSRYQDRLTLGGRPELRPLFEEYRERVSAAGHETLQQIRYGYGRFSDGIAVGTGVRQTLRDLDSSGQRWADPFDADDDAGFLAWLRSPADSPAGALTQAAMMIHRQRPDVRAVFPEPTGSDFLGFVEWLCDRSPDELCGFDADLLHGTCCRWPQPLCVDSPLEHARALAVHGPNPNLQSGMGRLGKWLRSALLRTLRHYDLHQRMVHSAIIDGVADQEKRTTRTLELIQAELTETRKLLRERNLR